MSDAATGMPGTSGAAELRSARRSCALAAALAFAAALVFAAAVATRGARPLADGSATDGPDAELADERARAAALGALDAIARYDSHPDPAVARVFAPDTTFAYNRKLVRTNALGMRERDYSLEKPEGVFRVVLLGDSYVFGSGVAAEERFGERLAEALRLGSDGREVEALHLGVNSWNLVAASTYLRRQLGLLRPDLVVQVTVRNDLDDGNGVRGFGALASFDPRRRERASAVAQRRYPLAVLRTGRINHLLDRLDAESRERHELALESIRGLADAVERTGGEYLLLAHWGLDVGIFWEGIGEHLDPEELVLTDVPFREHPHYTLSPSDRHWNPSGHLRVAQLIYGVLVERGLAAELDLEPWPEAAEAVRELHDAGLESARAGGRPRRQQRLAEDPVATRFAPTALTAAAAGQVHVGVRRDGTVLPYASVVLDVRRAGRLRVRGAALERSELAGARVRVLGDDRELGSFELAPGEPIDHVLPLPPELRRERLVSVRFVAEDFVATPGGPAVFRLDELVAEER